MNQSLEFKMDLLAGLTVVSCTMDLPVLNATTVVTNTF